MHAWLHSPLSLVLGSRSPRRRDLLAQALPGARIHVVPPGEPDEAGFEGLRRRVEIEQRLLEIARRKCADVGARVFGGDGVSAWEKDDRPAESPSDPRVAVKADTGVDAVIAADTVIIAEDEGGPLVLGQPPEEDWEPTVRRWFRELLAGRTHRVASALVVAAPDGRVLERVVETEVTFRSDVETWLDWYIGTGEPRGKAGGYGIQGAGSVFATRIEGSLSNVVGLPLEALLEILPALVGRSGGSAG